MSEGIPQPSWFLRPIAVPLQKVPLEPQVLQSAAAALVATRPRSFEIFWDGESLELCFGSSTLSDLDLILKLYWERVKVGLLPIATNAATEVVGYPVPSWLPRLDPAKTRFFFVGNQQAHCFAVFDTKRTGLLMTPLLTILQKSSFAWVQFEWCETDLRRPLGDLKSRMFKKWKEIDTPIQKSYEWTDPFGKSHGGTREVDHPAKYGEFHAHHDRISAHINSKVSSRMVAVTVRGVVDAGIESIGQLPFGMIEDAGEVRRGRRLGPSQGSSSGGGSKLGESLVAWWSDDPRMLVDMVERRITDPQEPVETYARDYLSWRHSLPFVILGTEELGLLVHLPSSNVSGLKLTRISALPPQYLGRRAEKQGITIGT